MKNILFCILTLLTALVSCDRPAPVPAGKTISVSILPEKYFIKAIAGDLVKVNVMIPPGASHSGYEPTARQMNQLVNSGAYFQIGHLDFELAWLPRFKGINPGMKVFDLSEGIDLISGNCRHPEEANSPDLHVAETGIDPHTWMSPVNAGIIASNTLKSLIAVFPSDSSFFLSNYLSFLKELEETDSLYRVNEEKLKGLSFIIYHPALAYLARDYGMEQVVLEFDGKEPPPAHIRAIIDLAREKNIHTVFVQKQFSTDNSRSLAKEIDAEIIRIDPLDEDWKGQMTTILEKLLANQKGD